MEKLTVKHSALAVSAIGISHRVLFNERRFASPIFAELVCRFSAIAIASKR